jgi:hypothetical protein
MLVQVAPAVSSAVGALFHELPRMDFHARRQLAYWFANHLKDTGQWLLFQVLRSMFSLAYWFATHLKDTVE